MSATKFIIPMGAAVPAELETIPLATGSLLERLSFYTTAPSAILPLGDVEMNALSKIGEIIPLTPGVAIQGLPGAFASAIFDSAVAVAGLEIQQWDMIKASMADAKRETQRTRDKSPWTVAAASSEQLASAVPPADDDADA